MVLYPNLVAAMAVNEVTQKSVAKMLGISETAMKKRMNGRTQFKLREAEKIQLTYFPDIPLSQLFAMSGETEKAISEGGD